MTQGQFGNALACAGDLNGDGFGDIIVGHFESSTYAYNAGAIYTDYGNATATFGSNSEFSGPSPADSSWFGGSVTSGDFNGDGYSDGFGAGNYYGGSGTDSGGCRLYMGTSGGIGNGAQHYDIPAIGTSSTMADFNGDGFDDLVIVSTDIQIFWGDILGLSLPAQKHLLAVDGGTLAAGYAVCARSP
jgi:hypothetical protein